MTFILKHVQGTPRQGLLYENKGNTQVLGYCDVNWTRCSIDKRSTTGYYVFLGGNLLSRKSKKQSVVDQSGVEVEYRSMALTTCEVVWIKQLLQELKLCGNEKTTSNPMFHERTKRKEIDCHFVREKFLSKDFITRFANSNEPLVDILTKSLNGPRIQFIYSKFGTYDLHMTYMLQLKGGF